ncbi:MAG: D-glycerate dehydrogenase [bacterium]
MAKPKVVITREPPGPALARVREACEVFMWPEDSPMPRDLLLEQARDAEGLHTIITDGVDGELLEAAPRLKVISSFSVGVDYIDLKACTARGIPVGYTPGAVTEATADQAFALMFAASRRVVEGAGYVRAGKWSGWSPLTMIANDVFGKTLGIVGLGRIGQAVARRARGFSMRILYHNRNPNPEAERELGAHYATLQELLRESDIVVLTVPYSAETHHLMDKTTLAQMKRSAYLINVARGGVVDSDALAEALRAGTIRGAGLDVTEPEPIPMEHPLLALDSCVIVPHVGTATWEARAAMTEISVENLLRGLRGEPLLHCANPPAQGG